MSLSTKIPLHIMPILWEVREALKKFEGDIRPGDIFMSHSPYHGGSHVPDVNVFVPIFIDDELLFFTATRSHWTDIGGMTPGSISGNATEIYQEGLRFPVVKAGENGRVLPAVLDIISANVRFPREALGDLRAQIAAGRTGERHLKELVQKYGREVVVEAIDGFLDASERRTRLLLKQQPRRTVSHLEYLDNDGVTGEAIRLKATVTVGEDDVVVDYTGTSRQVRGPINTPASGSAGMAYVAVKAFLDPEGPLNHGFFRPIRVVAPPGTVVNPELPAPTGGYSETCYTLVNLVLAALAGTDPGRNEPFIYYDYQPGGCGATGRNDGPGTMRDLASGFSQLQSMEILESRFPIKIVGHSIRANSGGAGRFRGGLGHVRDIQIFSPVAGLSAIGEHAIIPPFGLLSGESGKASEWRILDRPAAPTAAAGQPISESGGKVSDLPLADGAIVRLATAGGGGFGDPLERDPKAVRSDVVDGYVSMENAAAVYGVVLDDGLDLDDPATKAQRARLKRRRKYLEVAPMQGDVHSNGINVAFVRPGALRGPRKQGPYGGRLAELLAITHVAALRILIQADPAVPKGTIKLGPEDMRVLGVRPGERLRVRVLRTDLP